MFIGFEKSLTSVTSITFHDKLMHYFCAMVLKQVSKYKWYLIGGLVGSIGGWLYWNFVGCSNGTCAIKSNPYLMTGYGALMGAILFDMIHGFINKNNKQNEN